MADETGAECPLDREIQSSLDPRNGHHEVSIRHRVLPDGVAAILCCRSASDGLVALVDDTKPGAHLHLRALLAEVVIGGLLMAAMA